MKRKLKITGFTIVELITAVSVIAILVGILLPALAQVKKLANNTKQKAQIASIGIGLDLFKNDFGDYPQSHGDNGSGGTDYTYCGAQTLTEALLGQDLLGFNPKSIFKDDDIDDVTGYPENLTDTTGKANLESRNGPYLERGNIGVFETSYVFGDNFKSIVSPGYVICDVFTAAKRTINQKIFKVGTPVLYFKANTSNQDITSSSKDKRIYDIGDNQRLIGLDKIEQNAVTTPIYHEGLTRNSMQGFYDFITDPMISSPVRPFRPDSFLLISAGADGLYGTTDDVCNFTPNL